MSISLAQYGEYEKKEKCGLFGVWGTPDAAQVCYQGIFAQNHRGQESAGIVVSDGTNLNGHTGMGLVSQVFTPHTVGDDGFTMSAWRDDVSMLAAAYRAGFHRSQIDRHKAENVFDRSSFTRFRVMESCGLWNGQNPTQA